MSLLLTSWTWILAEISSPPHMPNRLLTKQERLFLSQWEIPMLFPFLYSPFPCTFLPTFSSIKSPFVSVFPSFLPPSSLARLDLSFPCPSVSLSLSTVCSEVLLVLHQQNPLLCFPLFYLGTLLSRLILRPSQI